MDRQSKNPDFMEIQDILLFLEGVEEADTFVPDVEKSTGNKSSKSKGSSNDNKSKGNGQKYCLLHGTNSSHSTDECNTLKSEAKRIKTNKSGGKDKKSKYGNKTWKKSSDDAKKSAMKEMNAFAKASAEKAVKDAVKKQMNAIQRKRSSDDESMSEGELNNIEMSLFNEKEKNPKSNTRKVNWDEEEMSVDLDLDNNDVDKDLDKVLSDDDTFYSTN